MKILPWICGLSLAANLALVAYTTNALRPTLGDTTSAFVSTSSAAPLAANAEAKPVEIDPALAFVRADTPLSKLLDGSDLRAMRDALEATGLTAEDAKAIIRTRIRDRQKAAREAIDRRRSPQEETWWYQDDEARNKFEEQRRADRKVLNDEMSETLASLFGAETKAPAQDPVHHQAKFLPEAKRLAVSQILQDYDTMQREARPNNNHGTDLPSDQEKRRFIEEERRRDLEAVLSPEELRAFDLRHSQTAQNIRWQLAGMKPSLEEYAAIFDAQNDLNRRFDPQNSDNRPPDFWQKRQEAEQAGLARLRQTLGEDRFIDYALSSDHSSKQVALAAERYSLPSDTSRRLWKMRQDAGRESKAIYDAPGLSREEKKARLAELGVRAREEIGAVLNSDAFTELKQNNLVNWVEALEKGQVRIYNEIGSGYSGHGL